MTGVQTCALPICYTDAKPGSYTLTVSDNSGKYADISASFILETDALPVQFKDGKLVKADTAAEAEAENFLKNIAKVEVGETAYNASGKCAVKIFDENGAISFDAESRNGKVFADGANGTYTLTVTATGYRNPLTIQIAPEAAETTAAAQTAAQVSATTRSSNKNSNTANSASGSSNSAPKTSDAGVGVAAALASAAAAAAVLTRRKRSS